MTEKQFENKIKRWLEDNGIYSAGTPKQKKQKEQVGWFIKVWGGGFQRAGIPDIIGLINGRFIALEVKAKNGKASILQEQNIKFINKSGGIGMIVYPKDFEKMKAKVKGLL